MAEWKVSVAEILGQPGHLRDIRVHAPLPGVSTALARLGGDPVKAQLRAESVVEGVLVSGTVQGATSLECARCVTSFPSQVELELCELYAGPGHDGGDDAYEVTGLEIDLEPMLRDALTLALPLNPLCRDACRGLCAHCGQDLNRAQCGCRDDDLDPRWAALEPLRRQLEGR